ncbi:SANT/Myb_domain [Hexamita inflata]|uniref:SANT/Myb domain n=1 Tax=Hexamita inflata TaxID=28002 RepID=A0AA86UPM8_9EUKA|nr:SANT/Myb domain [Hexamita inflata]
MPRTMQRWTEEEINLLNMMILKYKKNFKYVDIAIPTRSYNQVKSRYFNELRKQQKLDKLAENQHTETDKKELIDKLTPNQEPPKIEYKEPIQKFIPIQESIEKLSKITEKIEPEVSQQSKKDQNQWSELTFKIFE